MRNRFFVAGLLGLLSFGLQAQVEEDQKDANNTSYDLLSSYYNKDFKPFKKGTFYVGASMLVQDRSQENTENIFEKVIDGDRVNFDVLLKGGYYINDYVMLGLNLSIFENKFV